MRDLKKLACLLAGSFSLALLAGCGNNGSTTTKNGDGTITVP